MSIIDDALRKAERFRNTITQDKQSPQGQPAQGQSSLDKPIASKAKGRAAKYLSGPGKQIKKALPAVITISGIFLIFLTAAIMRNAGNGMFLLAPFAPDSTAGSQDSGDDSDTREKKRSPGEYELSGIVEGQGGSMALINGSLYKEGDMVKEARIVKITRNSVTLDKKGRSIELSVR